MLGNSQLKRVSVIMGKGSASLLFGSDITCLNWEGSTRCSQQGKMALGEGRGAT